MSPEWRIGPLVAEHRAAFQAMTFPAYRSWVLSPESTERVALAVYRQADGQPCGLILGVMRHPAETNGDLPVGHPPVGELLSVLVRPDSRGRGLATALLGHFAQACAEAGAGRLRTTFMSGIPSATAVRALLTRGGWAPPELRMLVIETDLATVGPAPWLRPFKTRAGMEIVPWGSLSEADRRQLDESDRRAPWIPPDLKPADHEQDCVPATSLALKLDGEVVGWVLTHDVAGVLRFTCAYMHPRLQRLGKVFALYSEAAVRMPGAGYDRCRWTIPVWHPGHLAFARRWMVPYATRCQETYGAERVLNDATFRAKR